jgi:O-antigen ligase
MPTQRSGSKMTAKPRSTLEHIQVLAIAVTVFALPLLMWTGLTDYNYAKCIVGLISISGLLALWGLSAWQRRSWIIQIPWVLVPIAGFILAGALSMMQATNARVAIQSLILLTYFVLLLWMIANVVQDERDVRWILGALLASGGLAALYGVLQYLGVVDGIPGATGATAIISFMGNRNHLGGFLLYLFYPAIILLVRAKALWFKALTVCLVVLLFAVMLMVEQVATRVAFTIVTIALAGGCLIFRPMKPLRANRWWLVGLSGAVIAMCVYAAVFSPVDVKTDTEDRDPWIVEMWEENSGQARSWCWWIGVEMLADHPAAGVGLGNYKLDFFPYKAEFATTERGQTFDFLLHHVAQAHNEYIQTGAEFGVTGLVMLLCALGVLAVSLWIRLRQASENSRLDLLLLTVGILAFLAHCMVSFPAHIVSSSLLLIVCCGLALSPRYGGSMTFRWVAKGWKGKTFHIALIVMSLIVSVLAINDLRANWLMERGFDRVQAGLYASAEDHLKRSLAFDFAPRQTYYYLAIAQIQQGKFEEAEENLEMCLTTYLDARVYLTYADTKRRTGEFEEAQTAVDLLLNTHPSREVEREARYIEAVVSIEKQDFDLALQRLQSLALDHQTFVPGLVALGQLCTVQNLPNLAQQSFESALRLIEQQLETAFEKLEAATLTEGRLIRNEIEVLTRQRDHVVDQLSSLL